MPDWHILDEADMIIFFKGQPREISYLVIIQPPDRDNIDLYRSQSDVFRLLYGFPDDCDSLHRVHGPLAG